MRKRILASVLCVAALAFSGCNDWERTTFNTLSSSKALLDQAQADYEAHKLPKTACTKTIIEDGKAAQTVAVTAMLEYESAKTDGAKQTVINDLAGLAPLVVKVQSLISNPAAACGGGK